MEVVDKILLKLESCIQRDIYEPIENEKLELKDLSTGSKWDELFKSICGFLNSQGGIAIIGIHESSDKSRYIFKGFDERNEARLKEIPNCFTNAEGQKINLTEWIRPDLFQIRDFMDGRVAVLYIEKLPEDRKYIFFEGSAFERKLTGDHKVKPDQIEKQKELCDELILARELMIQSGATVEDLDKDKLNDYIYRLNSGGPKVEAIKADIEQGKSFLERRKFTINGHPTTLGILVCGKNPYDILEARCQVDGYSESPGLIAGNKKVFKDNIIPLLESSIAFVLSGIASGISMEKGGTQILEYPERVIRETVNNALAHRDYSINQFINITISPGKRIEIKNPGKFRREQIFKTDDPVSIRHIIPIPKAQNPRLADVLKTYDRWEGKGWGMASLTNVALNNEIDVPYYILYPESIGLIIQKGKVLDEEMNGWLRSFEGFLLRSTNGTELDLEEKTALAYFYKCEKLNAEEKYTVALTPDNNHFGILTRLRNWNLIENVEGVESLYPMFRVNPLLTRTEFHSELRAVFGSEYDMLKSEAKNVLTAVYRFQTFGNPSLRTNAAQIGDFLYFQKNKTVRDVKEYNDYKRKIRSTVQTLVTRRFLTASASPRTVYNLNPDFERKDNLFG